MRRFLFFASVFLLLSVCTPHIAEGEKFKTLLKAAEAGNSKALTALLAAAKGGDVAAQNQMGIYYLNHIVADQYNPDCEKNDYAEAIKWWSLSAEQGHAPAQYNLGYLYDTDYPEFSEMSETSAHIEAVKWYRKAANQGDRASRYRLWYLFFRDTANSKVIISGKTSPVKAPPLSEEEATKWLRLAAEQGHAEAQYWISNYYAEDAPGHPPNYPEAYFWMSLFLTSAKAKQLDTDAARYTKDIEKRLSRAEIKDIRSRVTHWKTAPVPFPQPAD